MTDGPSLWRGILHEDSRHELIDQSAIADWVIIARGYRTVTRPSNADQRPRRELERLHIPTWATAEDRFFPGLLIPLHDPSGRVVSHQWKPRVAVINRDGKAMKYASAKGQASVLDVHPHWSADPLKLGSTDHTAIPAIRDVAQPLWITEGVKKADSLTTRGCVTVALNGVYNWRSSHGSLGAWEDIPLKGRAVRVAFDADARTNRAVLDAMERLGKWLRHKGASEVLYVLPPAEYAGWPIKGCDDFFATGGTLEQLIGYGSRTIDRSAVAKTARFTDAVLVETVARDVYADRVMWIDRLGWHRFDTRVWRDTSDTSVAEDVRLWAVEQYSQTTEQLAAETDPSKRASLLEDANEWRGLLGEGRRIRIVRDSRGHIEHQHHHLDADPAKFNTASGLLDLDTGQYRPTVPDDLVTKVCGAPFVIGARNELWDAFLSRILPDPDVRAFLQRLIGQAMYGTVTEHILPIWTGEGANGKGTLRDVLIAAFGDYATEVDPELLMESHNPRHGTFRMRLRGQRLVFMSETEKGRRFANATMKRLTGGDPIEANLMRHDPIVFEPSHTLVMVTNHLPVLPSDDPASWRRVRVIPFNVVIPEEERDGELSAKLTRSEVLTAVLFWAYSGYLNYRLLGGLNEPEAVRVSTAHYRSESDPLGRFVAEGIEIGRTLSTTAADLYRAYERFCSAEREALPSKRAFGLAMARLGHESKNIGGVKVYPGIGLIQDEPSASDLLGGR